MRHQELCQDIKSLLLSVTNLPANEQKEIDNHTPLFKGGLGLDSIDVLELVVSLEKRYGVKIRNDEKGQQALANVASIADEILHHQRHT